VGCFAPFARNFAVFAFVHIGEVAAVSVHVRTALVVLVLLPGAAHLIFLICGHFNKFLWLINQ